MSKGSQNCPVNFQNSQDNFKNSQDNFGDGCLQNWKNISQTLNQVAYRFKNRCSIPL